jgi:hypothetical protein
MLDYFIRDGILVVSSLQDIYNIPIRGGKFEVLPKDYLGGFKYVVVYDVRDLMAASMIYRRYLDSLEKPLLLQPWPPGSPAPKRSTRDNADDNKWVADFLDLVRTVVFPDAVPNDPNSHAPVIHDVDMVEQNGRLIVKHSFDGHRRLARFLTQLRLAAAVASPGMPDLPRPLLNPHELAALRNLVAAESGRPGSNLAVVKAMGQTIPQVRFKGIGLEAALRSLRDSQHVNISPNWGAMLAADITKDTQVDLQLHDVTLESALGELLTKASGKEGLFDYVIHDGVIKISTSED